MVSKEIRTQVQAAAGPLRSDDLFNLHLEWILPQRLHGREGPNIRGVGDGRGQRDMQLARKRGTIQHMSPSAFSGKACPRKVSSACVLPEEERVPPEGKGMP